MKRLVWLTIFFLIGCYSTSKIENIAFVDISVVTDYTAKLLIQKNSEKPQKEDVYRIVKNSIENVSDRKKIDVVLRIDTVLVNNNEGLDITAEVIQEINNIIVLSDKRNL